MICDHREVGCRIPLAGLLLLFCACSDDGPATTPADVDADAGVENDGGRDVTVDGTEDEEAGEDAAPEVVEDLPVDDVVVPDLVDDVTDEGFFPDEPSGRCLEGGNGARGTVRFDDGQPVAGAVVALLFSDQKHLGTTDGDGVFYIQAPCGPLAVELATFDALDQPLHPSMYNLPLGTFDASVTEPDLTIPLVTVEGLIVDVLDIPVAGALLTAELEDGRVRVFNRMEADEAGEFAVALVPWANAPYDLTAEGPEDSDKRYRTATLRVVIGDPPPEPSTFTLFEDRCGIRGTIHTSEGRGLEWLYIRVEGDPYPEGPIDYTSFDLGVYEERTNPETVLDEIPLFCGPVRVRLWNAIWLDPDWPCLDWDNDNQVCINNYPLILDENVSEPFPEGLELPVVRIGGTVTDELGIEQRDVIVRVEGAYQWGASQFDVWEALKEDVTDEDGVYSMVMVPQEGVTYRVTTRIRDDDRRPLGAFEGTVAITEDTVYDIELPEAPPRCIMSGTVHSSEGRDHNEILLYFWGYDSTTAESLYVDDPWQFFTEEEGIYYRYGFPDEEVPFVPFLCGDHDLGLHSMDWESCHLSPDEICFNSWTWWSDEPITEPILDGIEIPVVHVSGRVTTVIDGVTVPVPQASISAIGGFPPFSFVENSTGTSSDGLYDFVVLPGMEWEVSVSVGDNHPMNLDGVGEAVQVDGPTELNFEMPPGPTRCPFSGLVRTSDGVALESLDFYHFGAYYGLTGWRFRSIVPGEYFRYPNDSIILDAIPLICGHQDAHEPADWLQDFFIDSIYSTRLPSCIDPNNFDQPCLEFYGWQEAWSLLDPVTEDIVIPVVRVSGAVTLDDGTPIQGADVEARAQICLEQNEEGVCTRSPGGITNYARTRPDGRYQLDVMPSALSEYTITITTPLSVDLGSITYTEVITTDTTVDARFSLVD